MHLLILLFSLAAVHCANITFSHWQANENPVIEQHPAYWLDGSYNLNGKVWNDPCVLPFNGTHYRMYLTKNSNSLYIDGSYVLPYLATSTDGISWNIDESQPLLQNGPSGSFDDKGVETPSVVFFQNKYHMFYTATKFDDGYNLRIGHATSTNGVDWVKDPNNPILEPSSNYADFDGILVGEPAAVVYKSQIYLYVSAGGAASDLGSKSVIGLSTSSDGVTFSPLVQVAEQDLTLYPRTQDYNYTGYSTPFAIEIDGEMHIFHDVAQQIPDWTQVALHHIKSPDGVSNWTQDSFSIYVRSDFAWTQSEIRSPSVLVEEDTLKMWFAGHYLGGMTAETLNDTCFGIGYATASVQDDSSASIIYPACFALVAALVSVAF